ncbi:MAG: DEAD/DEAH box helicase [Phycisphaerales bacterium]|nr:DEAD/DEAH box helicase [Phycisphaerales bacterium]
MPISEFHPTLQEWFSTRLGEPTPPQREGWPHIRAGRNTLIAAPTGSGKTLAAFFSAMDALAKEGPDLPDETRVVYVSPLKALSNDVQKNLQQPLQEIRELNPFVPDVRVLVRTGDTTQRERAAMVRKSPHILVTTPESLYILLTSDSGRRMLSNVRTAIVDEIHALARDKRGSHLALSMERLEALAGPVQRIGLSATQKPIEDIANFLVGVGRECEIVDAGHRRALDVGVEIPKSPLSAVCEHETWEEIYERMAALIQEHRTTLIFVNTRKLAERIAARLTDVLGEDYVTCHHGSLSRERRLDAEKRLKAGSLRALVATASLELGIDIGDVDLAIQVGSARAIATFLQRVGRAGHSLRRTPKGRIFPLTLDELVEAAALLRAVRRGELDRTLQPMQPLDILSQQIIAACVSETWDEQTIYETFRRAWPYRELSRDDFDDVVALHTQGRHGLLHRDGVNNRLRGRRRARIAAVTCGGAIPDAADYQVLLEPEGTFVGTLDEDFAIESNVGDIFQLGNTSWRVLKIERGTMRVADAQGLPPTMPFWLGEAPARTTELSAEVGNVRDETDAAEWLVRETGVSEGAAQQIAEYFEEGRRVLGTVPTQRRVVLERFFDESGGTQLVVHAPFGGRINRAWGLALRKRFCRGFGFELQAAANEEAIVLSLAPQHSFPLEDVFNFLHPNTARKVLTQALLATPMFTSRWRWNATRSLMIERWRNGKRVPAPIIRMRTEDLLADAFPHAIACPENLPAGDLHVPMEHPLVRQTIEDCLTEAMDIDGFIQVLHDLREGRIERVARDTPEPSVFANGILAAQPYSFLDDVPLEERRTQAVLNRRTLDAKTVDEFGALDPQAVQRVKEEAWPQPENAEEVHEALLWMGYVTVDEARPWQEWLDELCSGGRAVLEGDRWFAADATREPKAVLRGRLEALGPIFSDDRLLLELESEGCVMRTRLDGRTAWCERRLLARIHRYTLDTLRSEIEPVTAAEFLRFLACWQHVDEEFRLEGPRGVATVIEQLAGFEIPAAAWETGVLSSRVRDYQRQWLDELTLLGEIAWGRLWGSGGSPIRTTPVSLIPREALDTWLGLTKLPDTSKLSAAAEDIFEALATQGAMFAQDLQRRADLLPTHLEMGLAELIAHGLVTCDSITGLRQLITPPSRRRRRARPSGRWSLFRRETPPAESPAEFVARQLLKRTGVVFRRTLLREKQPVPWRDLIRVYRRMELRGDVRGGRFVEGFSGEQYALPEAVKLLRKVRRDGERPPVSVPAADPLNYQGILTPEPRVASTTRSRVSVG